MNSKQKIAFGISLAIGAYFGGKALYERGDQKGNIEGKATGIYQTIKDLEEIGVLNTSRENAESIMRGTDMYTLLLKNQNFKGRPEDRTLVKLVDEIGE